MAVNTVDEETKTELYRLIREEDEARVRRATEDEKLTRKYSTIHQVMENAAAAESTLFEERRKIVEKFDELVIASDQLRNTWADELREMAIGLSNTSKQCSHSILKVKHLLAKIGQPLNFDIETQAELEAVHYLMKYHECSVTVRVVATGQRLRKFLLDEAARLKVPILIAGLG